MKRIAATIFLCCSISLVFAQSKLLNDIEAIQLDRYYDDVCPDFIRGVDIQSFDESMVCQIVIIRHGEPAMKKTGWKNRNEAVKYTEMYDSVGVYNFDKMPICLRESDLDTVFTSLLPRAIDTAKKTLGDDAFLDSKLIFNEFERKIIKFPNIKLPRQFWSITTRLVWMMGFNHKGIESFSEAKERAKDAASILDNNAQLHGKSVLFSHGFLNRYIKKYLKKSGYKVIDMNGQKYLGAYYFYKVK